MFDQYEQQCNAAALAEIGVKIVRKIDAGFSGHLQDWLNAQNACDYHFVPNTAEVADKIIDLVK